MIAFFVYTFLATWPFYIESWMNKMALDSGEGIPKIDITRAFCMALLILTFAYKALQRKGFKSDVIVYTTFLYAVYVLLEIVLNNLGMSLFSALACLFAICLPCIMYFVLINLKDVLNRQYLVYSVLFAGVYIAGSGVLEFIVGHNVVGPANYLSVDQASGLYRTNGPFWDVISYAGTVACLVPFAYWAMKERCVNKLFAFFCFVLFNLGALVSFSRAVWIALVIVMGILYVGRGGKSIFLVFSLTAVIGILGYLLGDILLASKLYKHRIAIGAEGRDKFFSEAIKTFWSSPVFGSGLGMFRKTHVLPAHNSFLMVLADFGLLGLLLYIPMIFSVLVYKFRESVKSPHVRKARVSFIIIILLISNTVDLLGGTSPSLLLVFIMAAIMNIKGDSLPARSSDSKLLFESASVQTDGALVLNSR